MLLLRALQLACSSPPSRARSCCASSSSSCSRESCAFANSKRTAAALLDAASLVSCAIFCCRADVRALSASIFAARSCNGPLAGAVMVAPREWRRQNPDPPPGPPAARLLPPVPVRHACRQHGPTAVRSREASRLLLRPAKPRRPSSRMRRNAASRVDEPGRDTAHQQRRQADCRQALEAAHFHGTISGERLGYLGNDTFGGAAAPSEVEKCPAFGRPLSRSNCSRCRKPGRLINRRRGYVSSLAFPFPLSRNCSRPPAWPSRMRSATQVIRPRFVDQRRSRASASCGSEPPRHPSNPVHHARLLNAAMHQSLGRCQQQIWWSSRNSSLTRMSWLGTVCGSSTATLMLACLLQERAIEGAIHRDLPLGAAAQRADVAVHARAEAFGFADTAYCASHFHSIKG